MADEASDHDAYDVGYRKPPLATRFQKGVSGNPRGRPKGARNLSTVVAAALNEKVLITENGRKRRISKYEAAVKQLVNRAAGGPHRLRSAGLGLRRGPRPGPRLLQRPDGAGNSSFW